MPPRRELCRNFQRGSCQYGDRCKFLHATQQEAKPNRFGFGVQNSSDFPSTTSQQPNTNPFGFGAQNQQPNGVANFGTSGQSNNFKPFQNKWTRTPSATGGSSTASQQNPNQSQAANHQCTDPDSCKKLMAADFEQEQPLWKLTCYGHFKQILTMDYRNADVGWKYGFLADPKNKNDVTCSFCKKVMKGGIHRLKQHLVGGFRNASTCNKCPDHVKEEVTQYMQKKKAEKEQASLLPRSDLDVLASLASDLDDLDVEESLPTQIQKGKRPMTSSATQPSPLMRSRQVGPMDGFVKKRASQVAIGKQSTINEAYKKQQREHAVQCIAQWMYDSSIAFNTLKNPSRAVAVDAITKAGIGMKAPTAYEVRVPLLNKEVQRVKDSLKVHREAWAKTGCSIMSDGWTDRCQRSLINFLVNCSKATSFIKSVDASSYSKTGEKVFKLLCKIVEEVGESNVVQVITYNGSNFVLAGALLEAKYPRLFWTPCAAYCIDLMLENIGRIPVIDRVLKRAIHLSGFIYQMSNLLNLMRRFTGQRNLLRPAKTRFATSFITLSSIHKQQQNLRKMFTSEEWTSSSWAKEVGGKRVQQTVMTPSFWNGVVYMLKLTGPLVRVLRLVDSEKSPAMGYIYEAMDRAKEAIAASFNQNQSKYSQAFEIIDKRWECQLHRPLHAAGHFLNPEYFYDNPSVEVDAEVVNGLYCCIRRMYPILETQDKIMDELSVYRQAEGLFGDPMAIRHRKTKAPAEWGASYGVSTPNLQQFAIRVLTLTCGASGCERNWSAFEQIHSKKRNRLDQRQLNKLVYVKYNRALLRRYKLRDQIDPISLKEIDECNEWLTGERVEEDAENDHVFEDEEDGPTWGQVANAAGVYEQRFNLRSRGTTHGGRDGGSSQRQNLVEEDDEDEDEDEEDDEGYRSCEVDDENLEGLDEEEEENEFF